MFHLGATWKAEVPKLGHVDGLPSNRLPSSGACSVLSNPD